MYQQLKALKKEGDIFTAAEIEKIMN